MKTLLALSVLTAVAMAASWTPGLSTGGSDDSILRGNNGGSSSYIPGFPGSGDGSFLGLGVDRKDVGQETDNIAAMRQRMKLTRRHKKHHCKETPETPDDEAVEKVLPLMRRHKKHHCKGIPAIPDDEAGEKVMPDIGVSDEIMTPDTGVQRRRADGGDDQDI
ncbi:hypothetical protein BC940DRAFT_315573 [Gongronella butleri]|nr:hypothetical protein BC940DRAFT_315573 [Gongronella butleri]